MKNRLSWLGFPLMLCASAVWAQSVAAPKPQIMPEPVLSHEGQVIPYDGKKVIEAPVEKKAEKKATKKSSQTPKTTAKKTTKKSAKSSASTKAAAPAKKSSKKSGKKH